MHECQGVKGEGIEHDMEKFSMKLHEIFAIMINFSVFNHFLYSTHIRLAYISSHLIHINHSYLCLALHINLRCLFTSKLNFYFIHQLLCIPFHSVKNTRCN